jgi:hypothetical protein
MSASLPDCRSAGKLALLAEQCGIHRGDAEGAEKKKVKGIGRRQYEAKLVFAAPLSSFILHPSFSSLLLCDLCVSAVKIPF